MSTKVNKFQAALVFILLAWPYFLNDFFLIHATRTQMSITNIWLFDVVVYFLIPSLTLFLLIRANAANHIRIMLKKPPLFLGVIVAIIFAFVLDYVFTQRIGLWILERNCFRLCDSYAFPNDSKLAYYSVIMYAALSAGFFEEVVFRGQAIQLLRQFTSNKIVIVLIASLLFALIHWCLGSSKLIATFIIGIFPTIWVLYTKRLWEAIIFHSIFNILAFT